MKTLAGRYIVRRVDEFSGKYVVCAEWRRVRDQFYDKVCPGSLDVSAKDFTSLLIMISLFDM